MGNLFQNNNGDDVLFQGFNNDAVDNDVEKICLFGLSGSGKSTLYHNLRQLYGDPTYNHDAKLLHCRAIIRSHCLLYIAVLINETERRYHETNDNSYLIDTEADDSIIEGIQLITKYVPYKFDQFTPPLPPPQPPPNTSKPLKIDTNPILSVYHHTAPTTETPNVMDEEDGSIPTDNPDTIKTPNVFVIDTPTIPEEKGDGMHGFDGMVIDLDDDEDQKELTPDVDRQEQERRDLQYAEELAAEYEAMDVDVDFMEFDPNDWKRKYRDNDSDEAARVEAYSYFDFDEFRVRKRSWEKKKNPHRRRPRHREYGLYDWEDDDDSSEWSLYEALHEDLIEDFGAYFEYLNARNASRDSEEEMTLWEAFGHRAAVVAAYFECKLNDKRNVVQYRPMEQRMAFTKKERDAIYADTSRKWNRSKYDRERTPSEDGDIENVGRHKVCAVEEEEDDINAESGGTPKDVVIEMEHEEPQSDHDGDAGGSKVSMDPDTVSIEIEADHKSGDDGDGSNDGQSVDGRCPMDNVQLETSGFVDIGYKEESKDDTKESVDSKDGECDSLKEPLEAVETVQVGDDRVSYKQFWMDMKALGECIHKIWNLPAIQRTYNDRHSFHVPSNMDYWLQHSVQLFHGQFTATNQHLSLYRNYSGRIRSFTFDPDLGPRAHLMDIPATTPELRSMHWTRDNCANSDVLIFTASMVDVFSVCLEDESQNAFYKSIELFYEVLHGTFINRGCKVVLLLTHKDRLIEYIRNGHSLKSTFQKYKPWHWRPEMKEDDDGDGDRGDDDDATPQSQGQSAGIETAVDLEVGDGSSAKDAVSASNVQLTATNTIDAMHNDYERLMQSIERKEAEHDDPLHAVDGGKSVSPMGHPMGHPMDVVEAEPRISGDVSNGTATNFMAELSEDTELFLEDERMERRFRSETKESKSALSPIPITPNGSTLASPQGSNGHHLSLYPFPEEEEVVDRASTIQMNSKSEITDLGHRDAEDQEETKHDDSHCDSHHTDRELEINTEAPEIVESLDVAAILKTAKCPQGHPMVLMICSEDDVGAYGCDICGGDFEIGDERFECRRDNWDLCGQCHGEVLEDQRGGLKKEMQRGPVWELEEYEGVEYADRLLTPKSDAERVLEKMKEKEWGDTLEHSQHTDDYELDVRERNEEEEEEEKMCVESKGGLRETKIGDTIWEQIQRQTKPKREKDEYDKNWKYILSGDKMLTYDGSPFDDDRWAMEAFEGYSEWIRDAYLKCKDPDDQRVVHCHVVNLVNQDDIESTMYNINSRVLTDWRGNWLF